MPSFVSSSPPKKLPPPSYLCWHLASSIVLILIEISKSSSLSSNFVRAHGVLLAPIRIWHEKTLLFTIHHHHHHSKGISFKGGEAIRFIVNGRIYGLYPVMASGTSNFHHHFIEVNSNFGSLVVCDLRNLQTNLT
jgi:hypothetical protein